MRIRLLLLFLWLLPAALGSGYVPVVPSRQLREELTALRPELVVGMRFDDDCYVLVDHRWLVESFLPYFRSFIFNLRAGPPGGEGYDCDNFAYLFRAKLMLSNVIAGGSRIGEVPCGFLTVAQYHDFGGVPSRPRARHALIIVRTDAGWFVVEPQTCALTSLRKYANLSSVIELRF